MELKYYSERRNLLYPRNKFLHYGRNYTDVFHDQERVKYLEKNAIGTYTTPRGSYKNAWTIDIIKIEPLQGSST